MPHQIQLHENEKILFDIKPQNKLAFYLTLVNFSHYIFIGLFLFCFFYLQLHPPTSQDSLAATDPLFQILIMNSWWLVLLILLLFYLGNQWSKKIIKEYQYIITNQRIINYSGFWGVNCKIIPYEKIVDVDYRQNPLQRFLGISSVFIGEQNIAMNFANSRNRMRNANILMGLLSNQAEEIAHLISSKISGKN